MNECKVGGRILYISGYMGKTLHACTAHTCNCGRWLFTSRMGSKGGRERDGKRGTSDASDVLFCFVLFCLGGGYHLCYLSHCLSVFPSLLTYLTSIHLAIRVISTSLPNCSTHPVANASSVKRLLDARARFRMLSVASSDMESAWLKQFAYSDSVLA